MMANKKKISALKKNYLKFLKKQEVAGEPFYDKVGQLKKFYIPICDHIFKKLKKSPKNNIIGLSGAQGSGKSTIAQIIKLVLKFRHNLHVICFSIDDYYKTLKERKKMAYRVNKLFLTRGVPGTHDIKMLLNDLKKLNLLKFKKMKIPKFDKSIDDRLPKNKWSIIKKKPDVIIFEGWCIGARHEKKSTLKNSINKLEKNEDRDMVWRNTVNSELKKNYLRLFKKINFLVYLKIPSFKYVIKWRSLQEKKLKRKNKGKKIMNHNQILRFIMFYERLTKNMIKVITEKANILISLDPKHRLKRLRIKS